MTTLIVERDAGVRSVVETALRPYCSALWLAASGADALTILAEHRISLLFLELRLPDLDGLAIVEKLERDRPEVRVFLLVDDPADDRVAEARRHGIAGIINKPLSIDDVRRAVHPELTHPGKE